MHRALIAAVFAFAWSIRSSHAEQQPKPADNLIALGIMEEAHGSNSVATAVSAFKGTLLKCYRGKISEGFRLYARFTSPLSEKEVAGQLQEGTIAVEANGVKYDPAAPHFPGSCFVPDYKGAAQEFRAFVQDALKQCKRY
jgi:hypothetical protein